MKHCLILICLELPMHDFLSFLFMKIALLLHLKTSLSLISYPCYFSNIIKNILHGIYSFIPISSAYVDHYTLILCLDYFPCMILYPIYTAPHMWLLIILFTAHYASIKVKSLEIFLLWLRACLLLYSLPTINLSSDFSSNVHHFWIPDYSEKAPAVLYLGVSSSSDTRR